MGSLIDNLAISDDKKERFKVLNEKAVISFTETENETEGGVEYKGYKYYPKLPDAFNSKEEIDEYLDLSNSIAVETGW